MRQLLRSALLPALLPALIALTTLTAGAACASSPTPVTLPTSTPAPTTEPRATTSNPSTSPGHLIPTRDPLVTALPPTPTPVPHPQATPSPGATPAPESPGDPATPEALPTVKAVPAMGEPAVSPGSAASRSADEAHDGSRHGPDGHPVQAGEIDDNAAWQEYLEYAQATGPEVEHRSTRIEERYLITVTTLQGLPVRGARITIRSGHPEDRTELITHADGRAVYHPQLTPPQGGLDLTATKGTLAAFASAGRTPQGTELTVRLPGDPGRRYPVPLDVLFLLDATGSMADEIARLKETLASIASQISDLPQQPALRTALVAYRDRGDEYITRVHDFDHDMQRFIQTIRGVQANGGGDYPESLNQALHEALNDTSWREDSVKLLFLLADAPPHLDYPQDENYATEMLRAQRRAVKIFTVASSGLDRQGEFIFRQLSQQTLGRFIFILYAGPQGELTTPHEVGHDYSVENLDRLIVRLITEELAHIVPWPESGATPPGAPEPPDN